MRALREKGRKHYFLQLWYAENNPVTFADPGGHAKAVKGIGSAIGSKVAGGLSKLKTPLVPNVTKRSTGTSGRNTPLSVGYNPGSELVRTSKKLSSLLDNIRIYNWTEKDKYYNELIARVPISALMSTVGGMTYAESVAAKMEAERCAGYQRPDNEEQKVVFNN